MRYVISIAFLFASFSSMAWVDIDLVSGDYHMSARLIGETGTILYGSIIAHNQAGRCKGRYTLDPVAGVIVFDFDGTRGPNTAGDCANESLTADIGKNGLGLLIDGAEIRARIWSVKFYDQPREARIRVVAMQ